MVGKIHEVYLKIDKFCLCNQKADKINNYQNALRGNIFASKLEERD